MVDTVADLESEIESLILKCKKDTKFKTSSQAKDQILDFSKKIDKELQEMSIFSNPTQS